MFPGSVSGRHSSTWSAEDCIRIRTRRSNIPLRLKEFLRAKPEGTPEGKGVYLTVYPELSPNTDSTSFNSHKANNSLISLIEN